MQWAHLPPRKKRTRTFLPLWSARVQGLPSVSVPRDRLGRGGRPGSGPSVVRSIRLIAASSVPSTLGRLGRRGRPALVGLPAGDDRLEAAEDGQVAVGPSGHRLELAIGVLRLLRPCRRRGGSRPARPAAATWFGFCSTAFLAALSAKPKLRAVEVGAGQRLGPHRGRLGELVERRRRSRPWPGAGSLRSSGRGRGAVRAAAVLVSFLRASICSASFA